MLFSFPGQCLSFIFLLLINLILLNSAKAIDTSRSFPAGSHEVFIGPYSGVRSDLLKQIAPLVEKSIASGAYPGAVILVGHQGHIIYRGTFGNRTIVPKVTLMHFDTIFDMASLTKVMATTPAIMQLIERGLIDLDAPVVKYWPEFGKQNKDKITIRELLTHTAGLPVEFPTSFQTELVPDNAIQTHPQSEYDWHGSSAALSGVEQMQLLYPPGTAFVYSNIGFFILGHIVELVSGEHFADYVQKHIFIPLEMNHTAFLPPKSWFNRIAPTSFIQKYHLGRVNDPAAYAIGGVAGHAGVFSNAQDLGIYAQCLLDGGKKVTKINFFKNKINYLLGPLTILKMTSPQTPITLTSIRGLGWDLDSHYSNRGVLLPRHSYGHTGWTGTSIWIDPTTKTWIIILTSRTHPSPAIENQLIQDRKKIANIIAASMTDIPEVKSNTGSYELLNAYEQIDKL